MPKRRPPERRVTARSVRTIVVREQRRQGRWDWVIEGTVIVVASLVVIVVAGVFHL